MIPKILISSDLSKMKNSHIVQILCCTFIVCNLFLRTYCTNEDILKFEEVTVDGVSLNGEPQDTLVFYEPEDRQKLCFYAAVRAKLPWVDFSYVPYWEKNVRLTKDDSHYYGMLCKGVPNFYIHRQMYGSDIQIRIIRFPYEHYEFDASNMISVQSVTLRDDLYERFSNTTFAKIESDNRKSLCAIALKHTENNFHFVDGDVGKAQPYEFEYAGKTETNIAISCPTSPKLYLCPEKSNRIKLVLFKSEIDGYSFEKDEFEPKAVSQVSKEEQSAIVSDNLTQLNADDRVKLCTLARQWNGLTTLDRDENVTEAQMYAFQYSHQYSGKQKAEHDVAILCPVLPLLYLRLVDENKIKLTFTQLEPNFSVSGIQVVRSVYLKAKKQITLQDEVKLQNHLFTDLDDETRWRICHIAQKYVLQSKMRSNFRFALAEKALLPFQLMLSPNSSSMDVPELRVIRTGNQLDEKFEDVLYKCTRWPEMYVRLWKSGNTHKIKVIFLEIELLN